MKIATAHRDRLAREALRRALAKSRFEIIWHAASAIELERLSVREPPSLLLVEIELLGDKAEALPDLLKRGPAVVVLAKPDAVGAAYEAMGGGALAVIEAPRLTEDGELVGAQRLLDKLNRLAHLIDLPVATPRAASSGAVCTPLIALGASTGGPIALATVLRSLPRDFPAAVLIVQHIEGEFTLGLAQWLSTRCDLLVSVAERGETPQPGHVYVAGPNGHLSLLASQQFSIRKAAATELHVPSVDSLFNSLADNAAPGAAALLTGMGSDGAAGLARMKQRGWFTLVQDEGSSVVFGMPRAALELGAATQALALSAIGPALIRQLNRSRLA